MGFKWSRPRDRKSDEGLCADGHNRCIDFDTFGSAVGREVAIGWNDDAGNYLARCKFMFQAEVKIET